MSWEPCDHRSPYRRIDLYGPKPEPIQEPLGAIAEAVYEAAREIRMRDANRIWQHLVDVAQGN